MAPTVIRISMPDSLEFNVLFVQLIESFPAIYDPTSDNYSNRNELEKCWHLLARKINYSVGQ